MVYFTINPITGQFDELDSPPSGAVVGPGTSVVGDIATWNNTSGTLLADSGIKFSTDGTLASDSDALSPTQKAVKTYVDAHAGSGIVGPGTSTVGDIVLWNNITGTAVSDSGAAISIDGTFAADSDALIPTQKATKTYVDTVASGKISGTTTQFDVIVGAGSNTVGSVGPGSAGQVLQSAGAAANPAYSTATYPSTATANGILYASAANTIGQITPNGNQLLITNASGTPNLTNTLLNDFTLSQTTGGLNRKFTVRNTVDQAGSSATLLASVAGATSDDPVHQSTTTITTWTWGIDNSVTSPTADPWVLSQGSALGTNNVISVATTGEINYPLQPAFRATLSANALNVTGNGTAYTVAFNTAAYDQNSDYNTGTYIFTAPVTGIYHFDVTIFAFGVVAATAINCSFTDSSGTTLQDFFRLNGAGVAAVGNYIFSGGTNLKLTAADTVKVVLTASGEASDIIDVQGGSSNTSFSGYLVA